MKKFYTSGVLISFLFLLSLGGNAQVSMNGAGTISQNFDGLGTGTGTWTDNSTITNWYAQRSGTGTTITASTGTATSGDLYNYGMNGASDRSLGSLGSSNAAAGNFAYGVQLKNNATTNAVTSLTVTYTLEQWRNGAAAAQTISFYYKKSASAITSLQPNVATGWTAVNALDGTSPITGGSAGPLDGNAAANRVTYSTTITGISILPGEFIMLKWDDPDHTGSDHGLSIDDVNISWATTSIKITVQNGDWNAGSTWSGGSVPLSNEDATVNHVVYSNTSITRDAGTSTIISNTGNLGMGATYTGNGSTIVNGTFQINGGGFASGNNFIYGTNANLNFNVADYTVNNTHAYWPATNGPTNVKVMVYTAGTTVKLDADRTINGTLELNGGWQILNNHILKLFGTIVMNANSFVFGTESAPMYQPGSLLKYNSGGYYGRIAEWHSSTVGSNGYPYDVQISNNTILDPGANGGNNLNFAARGNLTIDAGSSLYMDYGSNDMNNPISFTGDLNIAGNLSLSNNSGGDIKTGGNINFTSGYNFSANERAVFFTKNGTQQINSTGAAPVFHYIVYEALTGSTTITMNTDISVTAPLGGNVIAFRSSNDVMNINGKTLTIGIDGGGTANDQISGSGSFRGSNSSNLIVYGKGNIGIIRFATNYQNLNSLRLYRTSGIICATLGSDLTLWSTNAAGSSPALQMGRGQLELADFNLILGFGATHNLPTTGAGGWVVTSGGGYFRQMINANIGSTFGMPIGDATSYTPIGFPTGLSGTFLGNSFIAGKVTPQRHPNLNVATSYLKRYWSLDTFGITSASARIGFTYVSTDVVGAIGSGNWGQWDGSAWNAISMASVGSYNVSSIFNITNWPETNDFSAGNPLQFIPYYYRTVTTGLWNNETSWEVSTTTAGPYTPAITPPNAAALGIEVRTGHTIDIDRAGISMANAVVRNGGKIKLTTSQPYNIGGSNTGTHLTIEDGGIISLETGPSTSSLAGSGTALVKTGGAVRVEDGTAQGGNITQIYLDSALSKFTYENAALFISDNSFSVIGSSGVAQFFKSNGIPILRFSKSPQFSFGASVATFLNCIIEVTNNSTLVIGGTTGGAKTIKGGIRGQGFIHHGGAATNQLLFMDKAVWDGNVALSSFDQGLVIMPSATIYVPTGANFILRGDAEDKRIDNTQNGQINVSGTLNLFNTQVNQGGTSSVNLLSGGTLKTSNTEGLFGIAAAVKNGTMTIAANSTVYLDKNGNQSISPLPSGVYYHHLILDSGSVKTPSGDTYIKGNLSRINSTNFNHGSRTFHFAGNIAQTYSPDFAFYNVNINNSVGGLNTASPMSIENNLSFAASTSKLIFGGSDVTLKSSATNTARVLTSAATNFNYSGAGRFVIERFLETPRKWQLLAVPEADAITAQASWQEGGNTIALYGTKITDSLPIAGRGFDAQTNGPSVKFYDPTNDKYTGIDNTNVFDLRRNGSTSGYFVFGYGDRAAGFPIATTTLRMRGKLHHGTQTSQHIAAGTRDIVGNPYASSVDMRNVKFAGTPINKFYIWDAKLTGLYSSGDYQTLTRSGLDFVITPGGGSYGANGSVMNFVQSGAAIVVDATSTGGVVEFNEGDKAANTDDPFRMASGQNFMASLYQRSDSGIALLDGIMTNFSATNNAAVDDYDAAKIFSGGASLTIYHGGKALVVNKTTPIKSTDTMFLHINQLHANRYRLHFSSLNMQGENLTAYLVDNYKHTQTLFNIESDDYDFNVISTDAASKAAGRFYIIFRKGDNSLPLTTLPSVSIAPNPVSNGMITIVAENITPGKYSAVLTNVHGQQVLNTSAMVGNGYKQIIKLNAKGLTAGNYQLLFTNFNGSRYVQHVMVL